MFNKKPTRYFSKQQETKVAKELNGGVVPNSGATPFKKGDVNTDLFLIECKTKTEPSKSMTIQKEWLRKNKEEAYAMRKKYNALAFDFGDRKDRFYIIDEETFKMLQEFLRN